MALFAFGINHNTASATLRERVCFAPDYVPSALRELVAQTGVDEAAILCTCNRTDLYCGLGTGGGEEVVDWFRRTHHLSPDEIHRHLYFHQARQAARHIMRVASGLDSLVLGETQILGQIKSAYRTAHQSGTIGRILGKLFQYTFSVAKQVRTDTAIGSSPVSVAFAAVSLARQIFGDMAPLTALLIGAGETIELAARHLKASGIRRFIIANRTAKNAYRLAGELGGYGITLEEMPTHLPEVDLVFSATGSRKVLLEPSQVLEAIKKRRRRLVYMVDMAIPRDIDPAVGDIEDIYLYTIDDLGEVVRENLRTRQDAARQAEEIIDNRADHFMGWLGTLDVAPTIRAFRARGETLRDAALSSAKRRLTTGMPAEEALTLLAHQLTNKLLHIPTVKIRQAGFDGQRELMDAAESLLDIPPQTGSYNQ